MYPSPSSAPSPYQAPPPQHPGYTPTHGVPPNQRYNGYSTYRPPPSQHTYPLPPTGQPPLPQPPQQRPAPPGGGQPRHKGTLAPGQIVKVEEHAIRIERYLSEGGYAHVYLTSSQQPIYPPVKDNRSGRWGEKGYTQHCLKRIAFQDEAVWADVKKEIAVMRALPPNPHLTQFLGSSHAKLPNGGYEVYILMEFCSGGGIIDLLNKRLRDRLSEAEILNIFTDVCEAVAAMHALRRPLLHRDLKIENVLSNPSGQPPSATRPTPLIFKLCDFGSATFPADRPPQTKLESDTLALDLNKNTTLQYRSPEMVEPMLGWAVGLPSDVWALGVLLYKLCYYTTPFEEHGTLAIVNAKYTFPQFPVYSPRLQHLIASMLVEQPIRRPTVFEVLKTAHEMEGTRPEIDYPTPSQPLPSSAPAARPSPSQVNPANLLDFTSPTSPVDHRTPVLQPDLASTVQPQRRGRPTPTRPTAGQGAGGGRGAGAASMPRPPSIVQPPAQLQPSHKFQSSSDGAFQVAQPSKGPQVTGQQAKPQQQQPPAKKPSVDAFGLPSAQAKSASSVQSGFSDSFGTASDTLKFGAKTQSPVLAFGDSFGGRSPLSASSSTQSSKLPLLPRGQASPPGSFSSFIPTTTTSSPSSTTAPVLSKSPEPVSKPSSEEDGEVSFETRFPSIETLSSGDLSTPTGRVDKVGSSTDSFVPQLVSPVAQTESHAQGPSMIGSLTGTNSPTHLYAFDINQPRSTHVTGTAFKHIHGGLLSPNSVPTTVSPSANDDNKDHFDATGPSSPLPRAPIDLMTGEDDRMGDDPPLSTASSTGSRPLPKPPATRGDEIDARTQYAQLRHTLSSPSSVSQKRDARGPKAAVEIEQDSSSDDAESPETPHATNARPTSRVDRAREHLAERMASSSLEPQKSDGGASSYLDRIGGASTSDTSQRTRPVSMFVAPLAGRSAMENPASGPGSAGEERRPGHGRQSSINDMVSRFEGPHTTSTSPPKRDRVPWTSESGAGAGLKRRESSIKPNVAAKPASLRRQGTVEASRAGQLPPVSDSATDHEAKLGKPEKAEKPAKPAAKPEILRPIAVRHGETPRPDGWSKSSSGRSFPVTKRAPKISTTHASVSERENRSANDKDEDQLESPQSAASGKSSPEKQQSVNSLIARWNKGEVGESKPVKRTFI